MKKIFTSILFISAIVITSCKKKEFNCPYGPCLYKAPASEVQQVESYLSNNNITAVKHCSGMYYKIENEGTGAMPTVCSSLSVTYKGNLVNGNIFDQTSTPVTFSLFEVIDGWKIGLPLIKEGGRILLFVPPSLGYGNKVIRSIPENSVLIFDITLVDVR